MEWKQEGRSGRRRSSNLFSVRILELIIICEVEGRREGGRGGGEESVEEKKIELGGGKEHDDEEGRRGADNSFFVSTISSRAFPYCLMPIHVCFQLQCNLHSHQFAFL